MAGERIVTTGEIFFQEQLETLHRAHDELMKVAPTLTDEYPLEHPIHEAKRRIYDVILCMLNELDGASDEKYITPVRAAEMSGLAESTWRNKAAAGKIPGAFKAGKQWVIPVEAVREYEKD